MPLRHRVEIHPLTSVKEASVEFYTPQSSDQTMLVTVAAGAIDALFVHHFQTDQLLVIRGALILAILQDRHYHYIPLSDAQPTIVKIPPGIVHGAINPTDEPCVLVNAVLRHGPPHERDYRPLRQPIPYDMNIVNAIGDELRYSKTLN